MTMALAQHPELRERAREEVMAVAPEGQMTMEQLDRLNYLAQLSKEVRRFFAMNSATFFGKATEDMEIGGYRVPKGWGMIGAIHITMRSAEGVRRPRHLRPRAVHARAGGRAGARAATCRTAAASATTTAARARTSSRSPSRSTWRCCCAG